MALMKSTWAKVQGKFSETDLVQQFQFTAHRIQQARLETEVDRHNTRLAHLMQEQRNAMGMVQLVLSGGDPIKSAKERAAQVRECKAAMKNIIDQLETAEREAREEQAKHRAEQAMAAAGIKEAEEAETVELETEP